MDLGCGLKTLKYILFIFNLIFVLLGIIVLGLGIWVSIESAYNISGITIGLNPNLELMSFLKVAAYILIAVGAIILFLGFFGCCGAIKEVRCMLGMYAASLIILLIIEIVAVYLAFAYKESITAAVKSQLKEQIIASYKGNDVFDDKFTLAINKIQATTGCCGIDGSEDFAITNAWLSPYKTNYPITCCKFAEGYSFPYDVVLMDPDCPRTGVLSFKNIGCFSTINTELENQSIAIAASGLILAVIQILGIVFTFCLCRALSRIDGEQSTRLVQRLPPLQRVENEYSRT